MKAFLKNYRQSPRKVSLVAGLIKGKRVTEAFVLLKSLPKRASLPVSKLLQSAVSNAKAEGVGTENLYVKNITVDKGIVMKRTMPRARGSASRINKRTSHILINLEEKNVVSLKKEIKKVIKKSKSEKVENDK
ncbi:TPA: 50S ribosomal protein L22 [Candidatus Nomurabacteria bacterium]|nr:MAG: 50S ribosomal protein L22 [Parcubacteria bacterium RAAC4_OD1_1]HCY26259.1 50S ribosomal protein L22 [Candidatus Nomurabacteria bacterium]